MGSQIAHDISGIRTLTFKDGRWRDNTQNPRWRDAPDCVGTYTVKARRIVLAIKAAQCGDPAGTVVMNARWKLENGELTFFDFRIGSPLELASKPWKKID